MHLSGRGRLTAVWPALLAIGSLTPCVFADGGSQPLLRGVQQTKAGGTPPSRSDPRMAYAANLLKEARVTRPVTLALDPGLNDREAFSIQADRKAISLRAGGPGGMIYGVQELVRLKQEGKLPTNLNTTQKPDFSLRGNALFLMKDASYNFQLTPKEFPWFYDKALLTRYLEYLAANRFNTIFLWSGCLYPSIVEMPEYPDATDLPREQLLQNQAQFRWFTDECAKRNISVLMHFYNIQIPGPLAKARKIPLNYSKPTEFTAKLIKYGLTRFLTEFKSVGLYVCPGEALSAQYTADWINDVIFAAAKECGHRPTIVVRDWGLDAKGFKEKCVGQYNDLYTELKHNIEMIVSPVPDGRHAIWKDIGVRHIVNVHEVSDVKPFRWGSPTFVQEMAKEWRKAGISGAEVYGMVSWRWPYALDKLSPAQSGFWPDGKKLITFDRDAVWLEGIGRYLWDADRDPAKEVAYWESRLGAKFGSELTGKLLREWYETTGPILPGLQNLTSVQNMNWHPTVIGKEQAIDAILAARVPPGSKVPPKTNYSSRPVDTWFFERYKLDFAQPGLTNRMTMPASAYAEAVAEGRQVTDAMTPDRVAAMMVKLAKHSMELAKEATAKAATHKDEARRFETDSEALILVAQVWEQKVLAAIQKGAWLKTHERRFAEKCLEHLQNSVGVYERLVALTDKTYVNPTDMVTSLNWRAGLEACKSDLAQQKKALLSGS
jgi:hypothetical protein